MAKGDRMFFVEEPVGVLLFAEVKYSRDALVTDQ
jgi:hypothetical protein